MTEERTQYTVGDKLTPNNVNAAMRQITENYIAQLERTIDGYNMIQHWHAEMIAERDRRIAELEAQIAAMPLDALRRLVENCEWTLSEDYTAEQYVSDYGAAMSHFRKIDGAA